MSKKDKTLDSYSKWWLREDIEWSSIGASVVNRPTETIAFQNIALEGKYIRNLNKWDVNLTTEELYIQNLDYLVNSKDFDYNNYKRVFRKDNVVTKISKLSGMSEDYVRKTLKSITSKIYLRDIVGINSSGTNTNNYYKRKQYFVNKLKRYKRVI